jgi:hypothetical protein
MNRLSLAVAAALALAACSSSPEERPAPIENASDRGGRGGSREAAPSTQAAERDCFSVRAVTGFTVVDDETVRIEVGASRAYEIDAGGATCRNLRYANAIALESEPASSFLCTGSAATSATIRTDQGDECLIEAVRALAPPAPAAPVGTGAE